MRGKIQGRRSRFSRYVRALLKTAVILAAAALLVAFLQTRYGLFDRELAWARALMADADTRLSNEAFAGISVGSLLLVLGLCVVPIFMRKIDGPGYRRGLWRGLVSAAVFLVSTKLYALAESASRLYLLVAIGLVVLVSALLVEGISLAVREEDERSFRTDVVSAIASGLLFAVLLKLGEYALAWLESGIAKL